MRAGGRADAMGAVPRLPCVSPTGQGMLQAQLRDVRRDAPASSRGERQTNGDLSPASACEFRSRRPRGTLSLSRAVLPERSLWDVWHLVTTMERSHSSRRCRASSLTVQALLLAYHRHH
jgi:hypothetical protein